MAKKGEKLSPETIEKMRAAKRRHWQSAEYREKIRDGVSSSWDRVGRREEYHAKRSGYHHTPESIAKISQNRRGVRPSDEAAYRETLSKAAKRLWESEEYREKVIARVRDPEVKARVNTPHSRELKRLARKRAWDRLEPDERKRRIRQWSSAGTAAAIKLTTGTSIERMVQAELDRLEIEYRSQASLGWYYIDFLIPSLSLCLECDGDYWHSRPERIAADVKRDSWLRRHGYRVARLSESAIRADVRAAVRGALELA